MGKMLSSDAVKQYHDNGYYFPVRVMSREKALSYRAQLEFYEARSGGPLQSNIRHKVHLLFRWANELVRTPYVLDAVEDVIGPNILCWTTSFFIKEANNPAFVSWHQDSTYWGLDPPEVITAWVALSDAPIESGAMKFLPGSHKREQLEHRDTFHKENLLTRGQEIVVSGSGISLSSARSPLLPSKARIDGVTMRTGHATESVILNARSCRAAVDRSRLAFLGETDRRRKPSARSRSTPLSPYWLRHWSKRNSW